MTRDHALILCALAHTSRKNGDYKDNGSDGLSLWHQIANGSRFEGGRLETGWWFTFDNENGKRFYTGLGNEYMPVLKPVVRNVLESRFGDEATALERAA